MAFSYLDPGGTLKKIKQPKSLFRHNEEKRSKKMPSTRIRGQILPTRNKLQKINICVTTSRYEASSKNDAHLLSHNLPSGEKINWNKQLFGMR